MNARAITQTIWDPNRVLCQCMSCFATVIAMLCHFAIEANVCPSYHWLNNETIGLGCDHRVNIKCHSLSVDLKGIHCFIPNHFPMLANLCMYSPLVNASAEPRRAVSLWWWSGGLEEWKSRSHYTLSFVSFLSNSKDFKTYLNINAIERSFVRLSSEDTNRANHLCEWNIVFAANVYNSVKNLL